MNIALIAPTPPDINAFGIRTISSALRKEGHATKTVFLPGGIEHLRFDSSFVYQYPDKTLEQIGDVCADAELIGFSVMSLYFDRAAQVSKYLRNRFKTPIIWGGVHPTYRPEQSLEYADMARESTPSPSWRAGSHAETTGATSRGAGSTPAAAS
jgi:anaerobic magnesium-protoporphyrin IX monomethyl ester cyclase